MATVYRSCDLILKLSLVEGMFGPPLEMFHCGGTAIVYNVTGHDEYIVHGRNALVAERNDESAVVRFIRQLKDFPQFLGALKTNAINAAAQWPDWTASTAQFRDAMEKAAANSALDRDSLRRYSQRIWTLWEDHAEQFLLKARIEARIEAIYQSSSWRLTRPLRGLTRAVREKDFAVMAAKSALRQLKTSLRNLQN